MPPRKKLAASIAQSIEEQPDVPNDIIKDDVKEESDFVNAEQETAIRNQHLIRLIRENQSFSQNMGERKKYAHKIFILTIAWSVLIFIILFLKGWNGLTLSDKVIITLISSTTINFFGFFFLVTKYLFNAEYAEAKTIKTGSAKKRKHL